MDGVSTHPLRRSPARLVAVAGSALLLMALLSGCLTRSETVGDRFSGEIIVATTPDNSAGIPRLDIPQSMASQVSVSDFTGTISDTGSVTTQRPDTETQAPTQPQKLPTKVGTRATYHSLTAGQFGQLGDIIAASFTASNAAMDLATTRSGDAVRLTGTADFSGLVEGRDVVFFSVTFGGEIGGTNGIEYGDNSVSWVIPAGKSSDLTADARYPDPAVAALPSWSLFLAFLCVLAVAFVIWYARREHKADTTPRPGALAK
ncbi:MAG: DUF3153 domain-containing protein [Acidimicrobiia bacterium]|nr:MAG: DUF3153 domain-containing protein [Acidimicrobiia bacterium]